jgi:hypothetical protein
MTGANTIELHNGTDSRVISVTQYGMQYPNGLVQWDALNIKGREYAISDLLTSKALGYDWQQELTRRAETAGMNPYDYSNLHRIVERQVMVGVTEAQTARSPRPWPAPDPGKRPAPVKANPEDPADELLEGLDDDGPKPKPEHNPWA